MKRYGPSWTLLAGIPLLAALQACKDSTSPPGNGNPSIGVSVAAQSVTIAQGATGTMGVTVSRAGGYAGEIALAVEGLPTDVTGGATPASVPTSSTSATVNLTVAATAATGNSTITVRASGSGVTTQTATFTLTITATAQGGYTISLNPTSVSLQRGGNSAVSVSLTRTGGFAGTIALTAPNPPTGLTTAFNPPAVSGNSSALTVTAGATTAPGTYSLTITGTANGLADRTATLSVTVTAAPPSGNVTWPFCAASGVPNILAYQNGSDPWTKATATATGNTYSFNLPAGRGGVALITTSGADVGIQIFYGTTTELAAQGASLCQGSGRLENYTGTVSGGSASDQAWVTMGGVTTVVLPTVNPAFALNDVPDGQRDLLAALITETLVGGLPTFSLNRLIIRRNLNPAAGAALPVLDFAAAEAFAPLTRNVSLTNLGTDLAISLVAYHTATGTSDAFFTDINPSTAMTRQFPGVPAAQQATDDLHLLSILAAPAGQTPNQTRTAGIMFKEAADKAIPLGPSMGAVTVTAAATTPYVMPNLQTTIQPEYNKYFMATYDQSAGGVNRSVVIFATAGYLGSTTAFDITMPDLSAIPGWSASWGFLVHNPVTWGFSAMGWDATGGISSSPFVEGASTRSAMRWGELGT